MTKEEKTIVHSLWWAGRKMCDLLAEYRVDMLKAGIDQHDTLPTRILSLLKRFSEDDKRLCDMIGPPE